MLRASSVVLVTVVDNEVLKSKVKVVEHDSNGIPRHHVVALASIFVIALEAKETLGEGLPRRFIRALRFRQLQGQVNALAIEAIFPANYLQGVRQSWS